ncbi:DNA repair protein [Pseudooceanicola sp. CBS1P-1]|uniref:DNA repair protein n=1 Tax=Pseudooceanicola albus TaxID=2692189 RepID=A0A6L7G365_9RHOB|nr:MULTISPECIES: DNA repair protein [Pseudooceanicola]MBT9382492.1 DNA repair protein [Pseudooceanicola endophyticus]MXN17033.1 DNA repair protein [Pseudooceanicola albus]
MSKVTADHPLRAIATSTLQLASLAFLALTAAALGTASLLAAFGLLPWPELTLGYGGESYQAGMAAQLVLTALAFALCAYIPANGRILALETSHRRFSISMRDVQRAYMAAHAADRAGLFHVAEQYDEVRERLLWLRSHPDLGALEPGILEAAAQMSEVSQDLAHVYSDEAMARAQAFLAERQQELSSFEQRLAEAKRRTEDLRRYTEAVEMDESVARAQIRRLRDELAEILPELAERGLVTSVDPRLHRASANRVPAE